jgi:arginine:agmatine antiporter
VAVAVAVMISSLGALNGWTLLMGQVPMAAAADGLFPAVFGRVSGRGVPAMGIIISAVFATGLVLMQATSAPGFAAFYSLVVGLSTMTAVIPYAFCSLAIGLIGSQVGGSAPRPRLSIVEGIAFIFSSSRSTAAVPWLSLRTAAARARLSGICVAEKAGLRLTA